MEVDDNEEEVADETRFIPSAYAELKLKSGYSFREDLKVPKEILNITSDVTITDDVLEMNDVCSVIMIIEEDVYNILAYWYKKVQNNEEPTTILTLYSNFLIRAPMT